MKVGIIGLGVVGSTLDYGFTRLGHEVLRHDIKLGTFVDAVLGAELVFVCVPTPMAEDGACDTSCVAEVVHGLAQQKYAGLVVIKSTVPPGTTDALHARFPDLRLAFCPEFLREKAAHSDFVENHDVCIMGAYTNNDYVLIGKVHGYYPKKFAYVTPLEAEVCKYFSNAYHAMRIIFANQFYEVCNAVGADYNAVKEAVSLRSGIGRHYLDCNENFRAFGGNCLPKDVSAMAAFCKECGIDASVFRWLLDENENIKTSQKANRMEAAE